VLAGLLWREGIHSRHLSSEESIVTLCENLALV
jgi:hypothetical protein